MANDLLSGDSSDSEDGGAELQTDDFKVNEAYARRFEHNKRREEKQRLEEKLGKDSHKRKREEDDDEGNSSDESTSESEDEGEFATEALDHEILATLGAIRSKDPRVYDKNATFYTSIQADEAVPSRQKKEKPMRLQDYHRQKLLNGHDGQDGDDVQPLTYNEEQEQLKKSIVKEVHAAAGADDEASGSDDELLVAKEKPAKKVKQPELDVENADRDPETFLSNFMSSRAWAYPDQRSLIPFESDDEDEEQKADEIEAAYNMRFEDPAKSNETLRSHARDLAAKYSVRREEANPRQKKREANKAKKEAAKQERREEKARLRKLRVEEVEDKVHRIKQAAGLRGKDIRPADWSRFVDEDWDDAKWEEEMQKRFGDKYYAEEDVESEGETTRIRKPKKPKFDDDIDIKDIIPDFEGEDEQPNFSLSEDDPPTPGPKNQRHKKQKEAEKKEVRRERRIIEQLVDDQLQLEFEHNLPKSSSKATAFRYRETSPQSFGLTAGDILLAEDGQLNQFAGLKKLAAFRDSEKKEKDQKRLGKRARLRQWRKEVFGSEGGVQGRELVPAKTGGGEGRDLDEDKEDGGVVVEGGKKKRRRGKKQKVGASISAVNQ